MFIIILFGILQLKKLWKKTFLNIHQLSCFVGHPVAQVPGVTSGIIKSNLKKKKKLL